MKTITKIAALVLLALLVFLPAQPAAAKGTSFDGQVIFGQSYTLKSGDTLSGDLVVFGGAALIEEGATAQGNEEFHLFPHCFQNVLVLGVADAAGDDAHHGFGNLQGRAIPQLAEILVIY